MSFRTQNTLVGLARAAVDATARMTEHNATPAASAFFADFLRHTLTPPRGEDDDDPQATADFTRTLVRLTSNVWQLGDPFVLAPAMTAIVAAAAEALDLTGDLLSRDVAPGDGGVLFLPEPIFVRTRAGQLTRLAAITWATAVNRDRGQSFWCVCGWIDREDPDDPIGQKVREAVGSGSRLAPGASPYVLVTFDYLPIAEPVPGHQADPADDPDQDWTPAPDGSYVITTDANHGVTARIAYAFWRIQAQPLATIAHPPLDRAARRRAARASITHDTRVVMLRRTSPVAEPTEGEAKWHYRVRFFVRGHWRHLVDKSGQPYRIWIHTHIKGPDGAPLLHGEKVSILAR
jgi:hypothetical protein